MMKGIASSTHETGQFYTAKSRKIKENVVSIVSISIKGDMARLTAPYNRRAADLAADLGARWNAREEVWEIEAAAHKYLTKLAWTVYGTDGTAETVSALVRCVGFQDFPEIIMGARCIARRSAYNRRPTLGEQVTLVSGSWTWEGVRTNREPNLGVNDVVLEVRELPRQIAEECQLEIIPTVTTKDSLQAERLRLQITLARINSRLGDVNQLLARS